LSGGSSGIEFELVRGLGWAFEWMRDQRWVYERVRGQGGNVNGVEARDRYKNEGERPAIGILRERG
jgi:hypothetical protein